MERDNMADSQNDIRSEKRTGIEGEARTGGFRKTDGGRNWGKKHKHYLYRGPQNARAKEKCVSQHSQRRRNRPVDRRPPKIHFHRYKRSIEQ